MTTDTNHILKLAEIIREVDGGNRLGAAALAEAILSHPGSKWSPAVEPEGPTAEALASFTAYFCRNYPGPDTIIHKPEWHAPKIFHAAVDAIARCGRPAIQPEPEESAKYDEDHWRKDALEKLIYAAQHFRLGVYSAEELEIFEKRGRAVLANWGRSAVKPVPVSERPLLKIANFNDANGHCWCGTRASIDKTGDLSVKMPSSWELREPCAQDDCVLPHYAMPIPSTTTETP